MATVRKRTWRTADGTEKSKWIADYFDQGGERHIKTFATKKAADAWLVTTRHEVRQGVHTPERESITVAAAGALWIERGRREGLERSTTDKYANHLDHIRPLLGGVKLANLSAPMVERFRDDLLKQFSRPMARKILGSLKSIVAESQRQGLVAQNAATTARIKARGREEGHLLAGRGIPTKEEISTILATATGRWRPFIVAAVFTGMRASELRGLTWDDVDFAERVIHVRQRADQWGVIGSPKSEAGHRSIPMSPMVLNALREWKLQCPRAEVTEESPGRLWLVFPNGQGNPESHANIINRGFDPVQVAAGVTTEHPTRRADDGSRVMVAKYGLHALRHFFASWAIEQGFSPKRLQVLLGHSSIQMTFDVYGHLFPSLEDDHDKFAKGELAVIK